MRPLVFATGAMSVSVDAVGEFGLRTGGLSNITPVAGYFSDEAYEEPTHE